MISDGFRMISNGFHNSDKQPASVTDFGSPFAHHSGIWEATGCQSVAPDPQK